MGFNVPTPVFLAARAHRDGKADPADWESLPQDTQHAYFKTHQLVMDLFPELPHPSSKIVTDRLMEQSYRGRVSTADIEREVVEHAKYSFSGYCSRVEQKRRVGKTSLWEADKEDLAVRPRMRAVLGNWMGGRSADFRERFFWRHSLMGPETKVVNEIRAGLGSEAVLRGQLAWCDDRKTILGLGMGPMEFGEKKVQIFL